MESLSGLSNDEFQRHLTAARRLVKSIYQRSQHDILFKGKWYLAFARRELDNASGGTPYNRNGAADRLFGGLLATTNFDAPWSEHFRQPLRLALSRM
jgi:hypothetical protein